MRREIIGDCTLYLGDCLAVLAAMEPDSFDSCVTDPPAGIAFMGKHWDGDKGGRRQWCAWMQERAEAVYRVLKPGAHALVWALPRTAHWTATGWEDAGFEVREKRYHVFGSGFPKSLDVSKAIDKMDATEAQEQRRLHFTAWVRSTGLTSRQIDEATGTNMGGHYTTAKSQPAIMTREHLEAVRHLIADVPEWVERECDIRSVESRNFAEREVVRIAGKSGAERACMAGDFAGGEYMETAPATEAARQWQGWGTATKPAVEEWIMLRKPLSEKTVAGNVLKWSTGALNIDATRIMSEGQAPAFSAYTRLSYLGSASCIRAHARGQLQDSLRHIAFALRSYSTGDSGHWHNASDLDDSLLDRALCAQLVARLFPNGVWCGGLSWSVPDSLIGCPTCRRCGDEHTRLLQEAAQGGAPSLADALERICSEQRGPEHSHDCQCSDRPSNSGAPQLAWSFAFVVGIYCTVYSLPPSSQGRWPSNLSHDGSPEVLAAFARFSAPGQLGAVTGREPSSKTNNVYGQFDGRLATLPRGDTGTAARFFPAFGYGADDLAFHYSGKATKTDRAGSNHPTVKPIALMRWLCRLITPPGGKLLDPFAGSGTTLAAALREGFLPTGIEITPQHHADIVARLKRMTGEDGGLFAEPTPEPTQELLR